MKKDSAKIDSMIKEIEKNPENLDAYNRLFTYYLSVKMEDEAIEVLDAYLKIRKEYPEGECQIGVLYFNKGEFGFEIKQLNPVSFEVCSRHEGNAHLVTKCGSDWHCKCPDHMA